LSGNSPSAAAAAAASGAAPRSNLGFRRALLYSLGNIGFGAFFALNNADITQWLRAYTTNASLIALLGASHSFEGAIIQPVVGAASDRLRSPFGRRRPFLVVFVPICCLFLALVPLAAHLALSIRLFAIAAAILISTIAFNVANDPYQAMLADITNESERGRVTGLWYVLGALGQVAVLMLPIPIEHKFWIVALVMLALMAVTCVTTREPDPRTLAPEPPRESRRERLRRARGCLSQFQQANRYLLMFMIYGAGIDALVPNLTSFVRAIAGVSAGVADRAFMVLMVATAAATLPCGWLADRVGHKRLLTAGIVAVGVASLGGLWVHSMAQIYGVLALAGIGTALQNASAFPLLTTLVPDRHIGLYTGFQTAALSICGPAMILLAGRMITHDGYRMIFLIGFVCSAVALLFLSAVDTAAARREIAEEDAALLPA